MCETNAAVAYPAPARVSARVGISGASLRPSFSTRWLEGYRPVMIDMTEGRVQGAPAQALSNSADRLAKASMLGEVGREPPYAPRWSARSVSITTSTMSGRASAARRGAHESDASSRIADGRRGTEETPAAGRR